MIPADLVGRGWWKNFIDRLRRLERSSQDEEASKMKMKLAKEGRLVKLDRYFSVGGTNYKLKEALQLGPVIVTVDSSSDRFKWYRSGII